MTSEPTTPRAEAAPLLAMRGIRKTFLPDGSRSHAGVASTAASFTPPPPPCWPASRPMFPPGRWWPTSRRRSSKWWKSPKLASGEPLLRDISFRVRAREIVGLAGLAGAGRTETALALFGARARGAGEVRLAGKRVEIRTPAEAIDAGLGIAFLPPAFARLGQAQLLGLQAPVWLVVLLGAAGQYAFAHTRFFRQFYYIGSNPKSAHLSGIKVERLQIFAFTLVGLFAGLAGIVYAARVATASSTVGLGKELGAITACILGGASLQGGRGTAWGALLGVLFMALIQNMLLIKQVRPEWQGIILGLVLVFAVAVDSLLNRKSGC